MDQFTSDEAEAILVFLVNSPPDYLPDVDFLAMITAIKKLEQLVSTEWTAAHPEYKSIGEFEDHDTEEAQ